MSNLISENDEMRWFQEIKDTIDREIAQRQDRMGEVSQELKSLNKLIAQSRGDMDGVERNALRQMASMDDYRKRTTVQGMERLIRMSDSPYYGRIDFRRNQDKAPYMVYIGVTGLQGTDGSPLIHDWRAPICSLFYDYEVGPAGYDSPSGSVTGDITLKRQYKIEDGELVFIMDSSLAITDTILLDALAQNASTKMRQIAKTIQKEQNRIIRSERHKVLIVQGIAGSGKTSVALHRIAYLLFRHRDTMDSRSLLIFSPNRIFSDYTSNVLPELGEESIMQVTFDDSVRVMLGGKLVVESKYEQLEYLCRSAKDADYQARSVAIAFKASKLFRDIIVRQADRIKKESWNFQDIEHRGKKVLSAAQISEMFHDYYQDLPAKEARKRLISYIIDEGSHSAPPDVLRRQIMKMGRVINPITAYYAMFSSPEKLVEMSGGELDIEDAKKICSATVRRKPDRAILYEDASPILLLKGLLEGFLEDVRTKQVVVDEAQDYTPVQYTILRYIFPSCSWTILGDANQLVNPCIRNEGEFGCVSQVFEDEDPIILKLNTSYRASHELTEFTKHMSVVSDATYATARQGVKPLLSCSESVEGLPARIVEDIRRLQSQDFTSIAVLCKSAAEAYMAHRELQSLCEVSLLKSSDRSFQNGVVVLPVYLAKGLEFDAAIIYDAGKHNYSDSSELELLYTACTRALHRLHIHCIGEPSPLLPLQHKVLYQIA